MNGQTGVTIFPSQTESGEEYRDLYSCGQKLSMDNFFKTLLQQWIDGYIPPGINNMRANMERTQQQQQQRQEGRSHLLS
jgi:hypothetical protein